MYAYSSSSEQHQGSDPVSVDLASGEVMITLGTRKVWQQTLRLDLALRCTQCQHPVRLFFSGTPPEELLHYTELISESWQSGLWRLVRGHGVFSLCAAQHPFAISPYGGIRGTCDCEATELAYQRPLPCAPPVLPAQPHRLDAAARRTARLQRQTPPAPPSEEAPALSTQDTSPAPARPATQLSLF